MGDAKSLLGGTLMVTPLVGADGEVYAVGQGTVQTGAISASGASGSVVIKGVPTAGRIASGATVEREVPFQMQNMHRVRLTLRNPDFTTARRIADAVNQVFPNSAVVENPTIVSLEPRGSINAVEFVTAIEQLKITPDNTAKVVIDEVNGVVAIDDNVRLSRVAIAQGNLTIKVQETPQVSQPNPLSNGQTVVVPRSDVKVEEEKGKKLIILEGAQLSTLIAGLNSLGVTPRDMISILQSLKTAGALQAEIQVM